VDITNYIMVEIGHPTHVFDYDRIKTHQLILRQAQDKEEIITLLYSFLGKDYSRKDFMFWAQNVIE